MKGQKRAKLLYDLQKEIMSKMTTEGMNYKFCLDLTMKRFDYSKLEYKNQDELWRKFHQVEDIITRTTNYLQKELTPYKLFFMEKGFFVFIHKENLLFLKIKYLKNINFQREFDKYKKKVINFYNTNQHLEQYNIDYQLLYVINQPEPHLKLDKRSKQLIDPPKTSKRKLKEFIDKYPWVTSQPNYSKLNLVKDWFKTKKINLEKQQYFG